MLQLIKYEGDMFYRDQLLSKIKQAAKHMYLVYQNPRYHNTFQLIKLFQERVNQVKQLSW